MGDVCALLAAEDGALPHRQVSSRSSAVSLTTSTPFLYTGVCTYIDYTTLYEAHDI
jgi:hypothetical protein